MNFISPSAKNLYDVLYTDQEEKAKYSFFDEEECSNDLQKPEMWFTMN